MSAIPSPLTSPTATETLPVYRVFPSRFVERTASVAPSMIRALALMPPLVTATTSGTPSPVTSPTAMRTPLR